MNQPSTTVSAPVKAPGRPRSPLARQIAQTFETKRALYSDLLVSLAEFRLAAGGMSYASARKLIASGQLRTWRPSPRGHHKIRVSEIQRFLAAGDQQGAQQ